MDFTSAMSAVDTGNPRKRGVSRTHMNRNSANNANDAKEKPFSRTRSNRFLFHPRTVSRTRTNLTRQSSAKCVNFTAAAAHHAVYIRLVGESHDMHMYMATCNHIKTFSLCSTRRPNTFMTTTIRVRPTTTRSRSSAMTSAGPLMMKLQRILVITTSQPITSPSAILRALHASNLARTMSRMTPLATRNARVSTHA